MTNLDTLKRFVPVVAPLVVLVAGYVVLVQPRASAARTAAANARALEPRLAQARALARETPAALDVDRRADAASEVELQVPDDDRVPALLERLARLALRRVEGGEIRNLLIETGDRVLTASPNATVAPRVGESVSELPDPRFALFQAALAYTPVTMTFDASYARLGRFLWDLRELPTIIEIRVLELTHPGGAEGENEPVHAALVLFAYQRVGAAASTTAE